MKVEIPIIYEDNHLLVVVKPPNILSQGDITKDPDMLTLLKDDIKIRYNKPGNVYLGLVHRLDRPVGGVMVFAKTSKSASRLSEQIRERKFGKIYLAVIYGKPAKKTDALKHYLFKDTVKNKVFIASEEKNGAKEAILDYELLDTAQGLSLVKVNLHTGRPHQIRVQLSAIGHALYGDKLYGPKESIQSQQIALWSYKIECQHPTTKESLVFTSLPKELKPWDIFFKKDYEL